MNAANNIERARKQRGYSQEQASAAIGVCRPTYAKIEQGKKMLTYEQADTLSALFRITIDDLLGSADRCSVFLNKKETMQKYKQLIMCCIHHGADTDGRITRTKLAELVYLTDFIWYYENAKPMSGLTYYKRAHGPVTNEYFYLLEEMEENGMVVREKRGNASMYSLVDETPPMSKLSEAEVAFISSICEAWRGTSTSDIVDFTHRQLPWQISEEDGIIQYNLITQEKPEMVYGKSYK